VDPVPDPLLLRKSGSAGDRTRDLCICSQKLWPLDHRGGQTRRILDLNWRKSATFNLEYSYWWCWNFDTSESRSEYLETSEMWLWRRMEKIGWNDLWEMKKRNILQIRTTRRKTNWTGHNLQTNCLLIEGKTEGRKEVTGRRGKKWAATGELKEKKDTKKLKEEALNGTPQRPNFGRGYGPVEWLQHEWTIAKD